MGKTEDRNRRLDALKSATDSWAAQEKSRLEAEASFLKVVRSSNGAGERVGALSEDMLVGSIGQYLSG